MTRPAVIAIRPGEHTCCHFARPEDRARVAGAFARVGLNLGHRVVHLCGRHEVGATRERLASSDTDVAAALGEGRLEVRAAEDVYLADGGFHIDRMLAAVRDEHARALADGYEGLSLTGDVAAALGRASPADVCEYERRLDAELGGATRVLLCQYDDQRFGADTLLDATEAHHVELSPALAAIDPSGWLAAARVHPPETLRLAGDLDFESAA